MKKINRLYVISVIALVVAFFTNLSLGSVLIPFSEVFSILFANETSNEIWSYIVLNYRLPKAITAILVGSGLGISGLLMQTFFRNPLAGPYVLGLSSGSGLGVALLIMGFTIFGVSISGSLWFSKTAIIIASSLGSILVMASILLASIKIKDSMGLLIVGLMFASITGAIVNVLSFFSTSDSLQQYVFWSLGSLGDLSWTEVLILFICWLIGISLSILLIKPLDAILLGEDNAKSLGVNLKFLKYTTILSTCILTGSITAFAGPIAFVGLAIPHLVRLVISSSKHIIMIPGVCLTGAVVMLLTDSIAQLPGLDIALPINAVTSLFGAPIVIWLIVRARKLKF